MRVAALVNYKLVASLITPITRKQAALTKREHRLWRCLSLIYLLIRQIRNGGGKIEHCIIFAFIHLRIYLFFGCKGTTFFANIQINK